MRVLDHMCRGTGTPVYTPVLVLVSLCLSSLDHGFRSML